MRTHGFKAGDDGVERATVQVKVTLRRDVYEALKGRLLPDGMTVTDHLTNMCRVVVNAVETVEAEKLAKEKIEKGA